MGRFVYQPVPSDKEEYSKHGQIIADIYSGHVSTNHNNVIVSATKRIERKLEDVYQMENNIIEQTNVINNLTDDYYNLIENQYANMLIDFKDINIDIIVKSGYVDHIKEGIGVEDDTENSILQRLVDSIHSVLTNYENSANSHKQYINTVNTILSTNDEASKTFTLTVSSKAKKCNLNEFLDNCNLQISKQRSDINVIKNNLLGSL